MGFFPSQTWRNNSHMLGTQRTCHYNQAEFQVFVLVQYRRPLLSSCTDMLHRFSHAWLKKLVPLWSSWDVAHLCIHRSFLYGVYLYLFLQFNNICLLKTGHSGFLCVQTWRSNSHMLGKETKLVLLQSGIDLVLVCSFSSTISAYY